MSATVWGKFFWSDWMADPGVRVCSYAARGLWIDALCICAENDGYLQIGDKPLNAMTLARVTGGAEAEVETLLKELEEARVFSRDRRGCIYSRRILKDKKKASTARENGKKGGVLSQGKDKRNSASGGLKHEPQIPDTIIQTPLKEERTLALTGGGAHSDWPVNAWEVFWEKYPNRVGKPTAKKAFDKAHRTGVPWPVFWNGLIAYIRKTDDRAWCNPATWLNQQRWEDRPAIVPARRSQAPPGRNGHAAGIVAAFNHVTETANDRETEPNHPDDRRALPTNATG